MDVAAGVSCDDAVHSIVLGLIVVLVSELGPSLVLRHWLAVACEAN